jgi:hypothetical protein
MAMAMPMAPHFPAMVNMAPRLPGSHPQYPGYAQIMPATPIGAMPFTPTDAQPNTPGLMPQMVRQGSQPMGMHADSHMTLQVCRSHSSPCPYGMDARTMTCAYGGQWDTAALADDSSRCPPCCCSLAVCIALSQSRAKGRGRKRLDVSMPPPAPASPALQLPPGYMPPSLPPPPGSHPHPMAPPPGMLSASAPAGLAWPGSPGP